MAMIGIFAASGRAGKARIAFAASQPVILGIMMSIRITSKKHNQQQNQEDVAPGDPRMQLRQPPERHVLRLVGGVACSDVFHEIGGHGMDALGKNACQPVIRSFSHCDAEEVNRSVQQHVRH